MASAFIDSDYSVLPAVGDSERELEGSKCHYCVGLCHYCVGLCLVFRFPAGLADLAVTQLTSLAVSGGDIKNLCLSRGAGACNVRSSVSCSLPTPTSVS